MASSIKSVFFLKTKFPITNRLSSFLLLNSELEYSSTSYIEINCHFMDLKQLRVHRRNKTLPFQVSLQLGHFRFSRFISLFRYLFENVYWCDACCYIEVTYIRWNVSFIIFFHSREMVAIVKLVIIVYWLFWGILDGSCHPWQLIIIEKLSVLRSKSDCSTISVRNRYEGSTMQKLTY